MLAQFNPYVHSYVQASKFIQDNPTTDFRLQIFQDKNLDKRRYNRPTADEVAAIIVGADTEQYNTKREICLYKHGSNNTYNLQIISDSNSSYDPLHYVLMFPYGDSGWTFQAYPLRNPVIATTPDLSDTTSQQLGLDLENYLNDQQ